jgi:hypothetical protein
MSTTRTDTALILPIYAPETIKFTHTLPTRFTYFVGSDAGGRETFGLTVSNVVLLIEKFVLGFNRDHDTLVQKNQTEPLSDDMKKKLDVLLAEATNLETEYKTGMIYNNLNVREMAEALIATGHLPLILTTIAPAAQYEIATRAVNSMDIDTYFTLHSAAKAEGAEYLVKQDIMRRVGEFYQTIRKHRLSTTKESHEFYTCNRLLERINKDIIEPNAVSMPSEYVEFDLLKAFTDQIFQLTCEMNPQVGLDRAFIDSIIEAINIFEKDTVTTQKLISKKIYEIYATTLKGMGCDPKDVIELTEETENILQTILPLVAYLNSMYNPFARNGVFGKMVSNPFQTKAIDAYQKHESKQTERESKPYEYKWVLKDVRATKFNDAQLEALMYGTKAKHSSMFATLSNTWLAMTSSNSVASASTSQSAERRAALTLPVPQLYSQLLLITDGSPENAVVIPSANAPVDQNNDKKTSSPRP